MNEKRNTLGKIFSILMLLFFFAIILFMFFAIFRINEYTVFPAVMTFALINFVILLVIIGGGSEIANKGRHSLLYINLCGLQQYIPCFSSYLWFDINLFRK